MYLGCPVLVKNNNQVCEGNVIEIYSEDLDIRLLDGTIVRKKFWEIRKVKNEE